MSVVLSWAVLEAVGSRVDGLTLDELLCRCQGRTRAMVVDALVRLAIADRVAPVIDHATLPPVVCWLVPWVVDLEAVHKP